METPSVKVTISASVSSQDPVLGSSNTVVIRLNQKTEYFLINETNGSVSSLGSYSSPSLPDRRMSLELSDFAPDNIYQHLFTWIHNRALSQLISDQIVLESERKELPQGPLFMKLSVELTLKSYSVVPSSTSVPSKAVSVSDDTCAICLKDLSETEFCQLPHCLHLFHETCLLKWLDRGENATCPLCHRGLQQPRV